jgi:hypothetical protein
MHGATAIMATTHNTTAQALDGEVVNGMAKVTNEQYQA